MVTGIHGKRAGNFYRYPCLTISPSINFYIIGKKFLAPYLKNLKFHAWVAIKVGVHLTTKFHLGLLQDLPSEWESVFLMPIHTNTLPKGGEVLCA